MTAPAERGEAAAGSKYERLVETLRQTGGAVVAFSGGVDSALLLAAARQALGDRALAAIGRSPSYPAREHAAALELASQIGARHVTVDPGELADPRYRSNPADRCFICKGTLFRALLALARREGLAAVVEGSNADDAHDYRPGMKAARELGVRAPLMEVGLTKLEIRELARGLGLPVWDKPSLACLASRIPYGTPITEEKLGRIDRAEEALRGLGLQQVRVRDHGDVARIEVEPATLARLLDGELRQAVVGAVKSAGYRYVSLDMEGYRTGSMNEALEKA